MFQVKLKSGEVSEKSSFETWKCFSLDFVLFLNKHLPKWMLDPLFLIKNVFVFSHLDSSLNVQRKMVQMRLKGSRHGAYIHAYGER